MKKPILFFVIGMLVISGFGAVVTFELDGDLGDSNRFLDNLKLCYIGPSFGGCETLITHPATVTYYDYSREERYELGILDNLFRHVEIIRLEVRESNVPAYSLYERLGFRQTGFVPGYYPDGEGARIYELRRET